MSWQLLPRPQDDLAEPMRAKRPLRGQRYGHCYDTQAGDRLRAARAHRPLRQAIEAARVVEIWETDDAVDV